MSFPPLYFTSFVFWSLQQLVNTHQIYTQPSIGISRAHSNFTSSSEASFRFEAFDPGSGSKRLLCSLDASFWEVCTSPYSVSDLGEGTHRLKVRETDQFNNSVLQEEEVSWIIDSTPPVVTFTLGPEAVIHETHTTFSFEVVDYPLLSSSGVADISCWLNHLKLEECHSPLTLTQLAEQANVLQIQAEDRAGNVGYSIAYRWKVQPRPIPKLIGPQMGKCGRRFVVRIVWSTPVEGFNSEKVHLDGNKSKIFEWQEDEGKQLYVATIETSGGFLLVKVPEDAATSLQNVSSASSNTLRFYCDTESPTVSIQAKPVLGTSNIAVSFFWSEPVSEFLSGKIQLSDPQARLYHQWKNSTLGTHYSAMVYPIAVGPFWIQVEAGAAKDEVGNSNDISVVEEIFARGGHIATLSAAGDVSVYEPSLSKRLSHWNIQSEGRLAFFPNGNLAVSEFRGTTIKVYNMFGKLMRVIDGFVSVEDITVSGSGRLFVCDAGSGRLHSLSNAFALDAVENVSLSWSGGESRCAMTTDNDGLLYVALGADDSISVYNSQLDLQYTFTLRECCDIGCNPSAIEINHRKQLYLSCTDEPHTSVHLLPEIVSFGDPYLKVNGNNQNEAHSRLQNNKDKIVLSSKMELNRTSFSGQYNIISLVSDNSDAIYAADGEKSGLLLSRHGDGFKFKELGEVIVDIAILQDRQNPYCDVLDYDGGTEKSSEFSMIASCTEAVDFDATCISVQGAGGSISQLQSLDYKNYSFTVSPSAVGIIEISIKPYCVVDSAGNYNSRQSNVVKVQYYGGRCMKELNCRWELAKYEHQLAESRLRLSAALEAEKQRAKVSVQEAAEDARLKRRLQAEEEAHRRELQAKQRMAEIEAAIVKQKAEAEAEGRIKEARQNEDLNLRQLQMAAEARTKTILAAISAVADYMRAGIMSLVDEPRLMQTFLIAFGTAAAMFFLFREASRVFVNEIARLLRKPPLVRETNRSLFRGWVGAIMDWLPLIRNPSTGHREVSKLFGDVILEGKTYAEVEELAQSIAASSSRGSPLRNVLLWGPPGTGKTMAARRLAKGCGMGYAIMNGGDVVPLGKDAVTELHSIFDWAERSTQGVLLFIDEADAFLRRRKPGDGNSSTSEHTRSAINAVLSRTGSQSRKFMMVLASNRPEDLDSAVIDRIDDAIHFPLPGLAEREAMLRLYFAKVVCPIHIRSTLRMMLAPFEKIFHFMRLWHTNPTVKLTGFKQDTFLQAAKLTEGFSGRELAKLVTYVQAWIYSSKLHNGALCLSATSLISLVQKKAEEHKHKEKFRQ